MEDAASACLREHLLAYGFLEFKDPSFCSD